MNCNELKELAGGMSKKDREALIDILWKMKKADEPKISAKLGQIVKWKSGFSLETFVGVATRTENDQNNINVMVYYPEYKCFALTRLDSTARDIEFLDKYVDFSEAINECLRSDK